VLLRSLLEILVGLHLQWWWLVASAASDLMPTQVARHVDLTARPGTMLDSGGESFQHPFPQEFSADLL